MGPRIYMPVNDKKPKLGVNAQKTACELKMFLYVCGRNTYALQHYVSDLFTYSLRLRLSHF